MKIYPLAFINYACTSTGIRVRVVFEEFHDIYEELDVQLITHLRRNVTGRENAALTIDGNELDLIRW